MKQIWVDAETHLPVRVRSWMQAGERKDLEQKYTVGEYDFPENGPEDIYALGVPRNTLIVKDRDRGDRSKDVAKVIELATQAHDRFPGSYRLIFAPDTDRQSSREMDILYHDGAPVWKKPDSDRSNFRVSDWSNVRVRREYYFNLEKKYPEYYLLLPATTDEVLAWAKGQVPVTVDVWDGKRCYRLDGRLPAPFHHAGRPSEPVHFQVRQFQSAAMMNTSRWPTHYQWPMVDCGGPYTSVTDGADVAPGTVALHSDAGNRRDDYYLDPKRDYICLVWIWREKRSDRWEETREYRLLDLHQLPAGQWCAGKMLMKSFGNPAKNIHGNEVTWNLDLQILKKSDFPPGAFNGEKLLKQAKQAGAVIDGY